MQSNLVRSLAFAALAMMVLVSSCGTQTKAVYDSVEMGFDAMREVVE